MPALPKSAGLVYGIESGAIKLFSLTISTEGPELVEGPKRRDLSTQFTLSRAEGLEMENNKIKISFQNIVLRITGLKKCGF